MLCCRVFFSTGVSNGLGFTVVFDPLVTVPCCRRRYVSPKRTEILLGSPLLHLVDLGWYRERSDHVSGIS